MTDIELRPLAVAMLAHKDYAEEPKHALIDAFKRMRRERNAAYHERDAAHEQAAKALHTAIALEEQLITVQEQLKQAKLNSKGFWISNVALTVVALVALVRLYQ